jgi:hypothetical protein
MIADNNKFKMPKEFDNRPIVYGWFRFGVCLYVGFTVDPKRRFRTHNLIGKSEPLLGKDEIWMWFTTKEDGGAEEQGYIRWYNPAFNKQHLINLVANKTFVPREPDLILEPVSYSWKSMSKKRQAIENQALMLLKSP